MRVRGSGTVCKYNLGMSGEIRIVNSVHRNAESLDRFTHNMTDSEHKSFRKSEQSDGRLLKLRQILPDGEEKALMGL